MTQSDDESQGDQVVPPGADWVASTPPIEEPASKLDVHQQTMVGVRLGDALLADEKAPAPAPEERTMFGIHVMDMALGTDPEPEPKTPRSLPADEPQAAEASTIVGQRLSEALPPEPARTRFSIPSPIELPAVMQPASEVSREGIEVTQVDLVAPTDTIVGLSEQDAEAPAAAVVPPLLPTGGWLDDVSSFLKETSGSFSAVGEDERVSRSAEMARRLSDDFPVVSLPKTPRAPDPVEEMARRLSMPSPGAAEDPDELTSVYDGGSTLLLPEDIHEVPPRAVLPETASLVQPPPSPSKSTLSGLVRDLIAPDASAPASVASEQKVASEVVVPVVSASVPELAPEPAAPELSAALDEAPELDAGGAPASDPPTAFATPEQVATSEASAASEETKSPDEPGSAEPVAAEPAPDEPVVDDEVIPERAVPSEEGVGPDLPAVADPKVSYDSQSAERAGQGGQTETEEFVAPDGAHEPASVTLDPVEAATAVAAAAAAVMDEPPAWGILRGYGTRPARRSRRVATAGSYAKRKRRPRVDAPPPEIEDSELELLEQEDAGSAASWDHETSPVIAIDPSSLNVAGRQQAQSAGAEANATIALHPSADFLGTGQGDAEPVQSGEASHAAGPVAVPGIALRTDTDALDETLAEWGDEETSTRKTIPSDVVDGAPAHAAFAETVASKSVEGKQQRSFIAWAAMGAVAGLGVALVAWIILRAMTTG